MCLEQDGGCGRFIYLPRLYSHAPVLDMVNPSDAMIAGHLVQLHDKVDTVHWPVIEADGDALGETNLHVSRLVRGLVSRLRPGESVFRRLCPGVFQDSTLNGFTPQAFIDGVGAAYSYWNGNISTCRS